MDLRAEDLGPPSVTVVAGGLIDTFSWPPQVGEDYASRRQGMLTALLDTLETTSDSKNLDAEPEWGQN